MPSLDYQPHWTKPPLTYWAIAAGIRTIGLNEWGARLYNAVAFVLTVFAVVAIGNTLWNASTGIAAGLIYLTAPFPVFGAYAVSTDTLLTLWETLAALCYMKAFHRPTHGRNSLGWILGMWSSWGLAFLTKGPPALLPTAAFFLFHIVRKRSLRTFLHPWGLCLFILIGFSWYGYMALSYPGLSSYWLGKEVVARISSDEMNRNPQWYKPFIIYLPIITFGLGPWLFFLIRLMIREGVFKVKEFVGGLLRSDHRLLLFSWFFVPFTIFWIARSRLPLYLLPLFVPLTLVLGREVSSNQLSKQVPSKIIIIAIAASLLLIGAKGYMAFYPHRNDMKALYELCGVKKQDSYEVITVDEPKLYGLQFYLNGKLERVSSNSKAPWAHETLEEAVEEFYTKPQFPTHYFVTSKSKATSLESTLQKANVPYHRRENRYWVVFVVVKSFHETS